MRRRGGCAGRGDCEGAAKTAMSADVRCSKHMSESFQRAVSVLAKRWTPLILYVLSERPRRFNEIADQIQFVSDRMLSERLKELEGEGLIDRRIFAEVPVRVEYSLTEKGKDLEPVLMTIGAWARKWLEAGAPDSATSRHALTLLLPSSDSPLKGGD